MDDFELLKNEGLMEYFNKFLDILSDFVCSDDFYIKKQGDNFVVILRCSEEEADGFFSKYSEFRRKAIEELPRECRSRFRVMLDVRMLERKNDG